MGEYGGANEGAMGKNIPRRMSEAQKGVVIRSLFR